MVDVATPKSNKRCFSMRSPETPDSMTEQDTKRINTASVSVSAIELELPEDTPSWAKAIAKALSNKIDNVEASLAKSMDHVSDQMSENSETIKIIQTNAESLKSDIDLLKKENQMLKEKLVKIEAHDRRDNLLFFGYGEKKGETYESLSKLVRKTIKEELCLDSDDMLFTRVHRSPPGPVRSDRKNGDRPVLVKFHYYGHRQNVWSKRKSLTDKIKVAEDFPYEIQKRRQLLKPILTQAKKHEDYKDKTFLKVDQLVVKGVTYTVDTLHKLPSALDPKKIATPVKNDVTCFWGRASPLSNHHPAPIQFQGIRYPTAEHFYFHQMALFAGQHIIARQILSDEDPVKAKATSKVLVSDKELMDKWRTEKDATMYLVVTQKFSQNELLRKFLLNTGSSKLAEASPYDHYWGTGLNLRHSDAFSPTAWTGSNKLGLILEKVRAELQYK